VNVPLHIALAAGALVWGAVLTTSHAFEPAGAEAEVVAVETTAS
jgi:hypothetical protein